MSQRTLFSSALTEGVDVELLQADSFTDSFQIGLKINGEVASVLSVEKKQRTGTIVCKPQIQKTIYIKQKTNRPAGTENLDEIDQDQDQDQDQDDMYTPNDGKPSANLDDI